MLKSYKSILFLCSLVLCVATVSAADETKEQASASETTFLAKENGRVLKSEGDIHTPYAPESTFKIPLSLMGFNAGILKSENEPSYALPEGTDPYINTCKGDHNPRTWMRDSCLWYSQILTTQLGMEKFQHFVNAFSYGNRDLSGDKGKNNGLIRAWISSSLKISPNAQAEFLQKLVDRTLPVRETDYDKAKKIMFIQELPGGWKLYGKTGNGRQIDASGNKTNLQHGWFMGYIERDSRKIVFVSHVVDRKKQSTFASFRAKNEALTKLWYLIEEIEK